MLFNPLEQFEIVSLLSFNLGFVDLSFTNSTFFMLLAIIIILSGVRLVSYAGNGFFIPNRWQLIYESFYTFVFEISWENIGTKGQVFFPFIFYMFSFVLVCNLIGLVPYSFTVTAHLIVTFSLSAIVWFGKLFVGFRNHGLAFFGILLPQGVPLAIVPFFVIVEFLSFLIPLIALGVRLFANIIAGHILLKVIVGFCWTIITGSFFLFLSHFIPLFVLFLLLFLETAVAFIQAYIFSILSCLMLGDALKGGH